ncbi:uncharacterized protein LOC130495566 [Raphanus sativus]|uniref:Uncharacterized protein LOC130495566 n=1 Tax=Raphanus sativus TaxID=3726 RepID=A0A9W3BUN6_RAPSA|nr:uncharacterized protein LOC130495566 [Raphanus sativus]
MSWQGRKNKVMVKCRLDRALANEDWHTLFPCSYTEYLGLVGSDHRPIVAFLEDKVQKRRGQFRFYKRWIGQNGLIETIARGWDDTSRNNEGERESNFVSRIINCRHEISTWRKNNPPYGKEKIGDLQKALEEVQTDNNSTQEDILNISKKLQEAYKDEEEYWHQKSRNTWNTAGDLNTKFYHGLTKQRRTRNRIVGLYDENGNWVVKDQGLEKVAVDYFEDLFQTTSPTEFDGFLEEVSSSITPQMNQRLIRLATEEEVRQALFMMHPEKAPGPDGMTALFFQHSWNIIKKELLDLVNDFITSGELDIRLNTTNICLIPKTEKPTKMKELRPISLCNVGYKIISNVLCQRLKVCLPLLISETQSAFVPGRLISDNILIAQKMFYVLRTNKACQNKFMAIKTDMSKAYDRVEWRFIEEVLLKMGFDHHWIKLIMECISSVQYRVLLNGQPRGNIIPERGLRQGDPLSPYLFILCTEALIANINKAEREKQLTGIKVARACPSISHLLFADDSLFFCKAKKEECQTIIRILKEYEKVSGQQINFDKSSIQFGHKIGDPERQELRDILGIQNQGGIGFYLGIPENLSGSKIQVFGFIHERLNDRVNGWTFRFFSKGGKEVIIKSVVTALPNHVMASFRIPKTVIKKLTSVVAKFWWSPGGATRGMHWQSWDKVCLPKEEGGLGFKDFMDFNTAMLGKQFWRLIEKPQALFSRVFKGRYFRNSSPLEPIRSYSASYGWRSIVSARSLVSKGLIKRVGSGSTISVWNDPWLPSTRPRPANKNHHNQFPDLTVDSLINENSRTWNIQTIQSLVDPEDVKIILSIPLSRSMITDRDGWHFNNNGRYTVKSGYQIERVYPDRDRALPELGPSITPLKAQCWKIKCPPKMKHFLWQMLSGCIAVKKNLKARGIQGDTICTRCGDQEESINHIFFECPPAVQVWALSSIPSNPTIFSSNSLFANMDHLFWRVTPVSEDHHFAWILWYIWKARNCKVFSNLDIDPRDTLQLAETESRLWKEAQNSINQGLEVSTITATPQVQLIPGIWCFSDGSWKVNENLSGQGWYSTLEGFDGLMGARNTRASLSPLHSEIEALIWAMECMRNLRQYNVTFATDCSQVVKIVSEPDEWPAFASYLEDIKSLRRSFTSSEVVHVPRTKNMKTDCLARSAKKQTSYIVHMDTDPPVWLTESI